jgi:hypothetical protein
MSIQSVSECSRRMVAHSSSAPEQSARRFLHFRPTRTLAQLRKHTRVQFVTGTYSEPPMPWLTRYLRRIIMSALTDLQAAVAKLSADVGTKLAAKDAQIADLTAQLAAAQAAASDGPALTDLASQVNALDATVQP